MLRNKFLWINISSNYMSLILSFCNHEICYCHYATLGYHNSELMNAGYATGHKQMSSILFITVL